MRALYDTTIRASGIVARADPLARVLDAVITGQVEPVTSDYILEERRRTLGTRPYFVARISSFERETYITRLQAVASLVSPPGDVVGVVADPNDDPFRDAAVSAPVDYLITGDKRLLAVDEYAGSKNVTARAFYDLLTAMGAAKTSNLPAAPTTGIPRRRP